MRFLPSPRAAAAAVGAVLILALVGPAALAQSPPATPPSTPVEEQKAAPAPAETQQAEPAVSDEEPGTTVNTDPDKDATPGGAKVYDALSKTLFIALALALVLESALAVVFNWRPFLLYFDGRGIRTLISFGFGLTIAMSLGFDLVARLYEGVQTTPLLRPADPVGYFLTALVLAGGSASVNTIFKGLGLRTVGTRDDVAPKPPPEQAWIAVSLNRKNAVGPVEVFVTDVSGVATLVGMITGNAHPPGLLRWLVRDDMRFPTAGGHALAGDADYAVSIAGKDRNGKPLTDSWGPFHIGKGAIIDLTLTA